MQVKSIDLALMVLLLLLTAWLGARMLTADMLWWDELLSLRFAGGAQFGPLSPQGVLQRLIEESPWDAPAYHLALAAWGQVAGWSVFAVRALSLFIGLLAVAFSYRLGHTLVNRQTGLAAAFILGLSAFFIWYFHELRAYALYVLLVICCVWSYWHLIHMRLLRPAAVLLFVGAVAALLYTNYFAAIVIVPLGVYHLLFIPKNRRWWLIIGLTGAAGLIFLPYMFSAVFSAVRTVFTGDSWWRQLNLSTEELTMFMLYGFTNGVVPLALLLIPAAWIAPTSRGLRFIWFITLFVLAFALVLNIIVPFIKHLRHILMLWPLLALLLGSGLVWLWQASRTRLAALAIIVIWGGAGIYHSVTPDFNDYIFRDAHLAFFRPHLPLNELAQIIAREASVEDVVVFDAPLQSWALSGTFEYYMSPLPVTFAMSDWLPGEQDTYKEHASAFLVDHSRVWFGTEQNIPAGFRQEVFQSLLADEFVQCRVALDYPDLRLALYARSAACCAPAPDAVPVINYENGAAVLHYELEQRVDNALVVLAAWRVPPEIPASTYSVSWHVLDTEGQSAAQADTPLPAAAFSCHTTVIPLDSLPAGEYTFNVILYDWATGERVVGVWQANGQPSDMVQLEIITLR